jgi:asparagine synthase (glutamine-hydrolysing)
MTNIAAVFEQRPTAWSRPQLVRFAYVVGGLFAGWRQPSPGNRAPPDQLVAYDLTDPFQIGAHAASGTFTSRFRDQVENSDQKPADFFRCTQRGNRVDIELIALLCRGYLLENGLAQGDRLSMANSVELRLPLVDYRLAETLVGIQKTAPAYGNRPKALLVDATRDLVPDYVVNRPKRGFSPPVKTWVSALRQRYGRELVDGALVGNEVLDRRAAGRLAVAGSRFSAGHDLFQKYLVLEHWFQGMQSAARTAHANRAT